MYLLTHILSVAETSAASGWPDFPIPAQYGIAGFLIAALVSGKLLVPRYTLDRERERADRMEEDNRQLHSLLQDKAIPVISESIAAIKESQTLLLQIRQEKDIDEEVEKRIRDIRKNPPKSNGG